MNESIEAYLAFLWTQFQYDWSVFSNPWILYTILPALGYFVFFLVKWYILLAPITIPISTLTHGLKQKDSVDIKDAGKKVNRLLKG